MANAQSHNNSTIKKHKIAVFSPLYLDSAFDGNMYKYGKSFPIGGFEDLPQKK